MVVRRRQVDLFFVLAIREKRDGREEDCTVYGSVVLYDTTVPRRLYRVVSTVVFFRHTNTIPGTTDKKDTTILNITSTCYQTGRKNFFN